MSIIKPELDSKTLKNNPFLSDSIDSIWRSIKEKMRIYVSDIVLKNYYSDTYISEINPNCVIFRCSETYKKEWIEANNINLLQKLAKQAIGYEVEVILQVSTTDNSQENKLDKAYEYYDVSSNQTIFPTQSQQQTKMLMDGKYKFDNYIVGPSNQIAHAVAEAVSQNPGAIYNPVFIYGNTGVGKTHLMIAIGNQVLKNYPDKKVVYIPIENFLNDLIDGIRRKNTVDFRKKYRDIDMIIIDDIQTTGRYPTVQDELFNTFNSLYLANKQILVASDRHPKELEDIADRLKSRFEGGMVVEIKPPDPDTRLAILTQKAEEMKISISNEILSFLAQNIEQNVRELEGAINKLSSIIKFTNSTPTIEDISNMLKLDIESKRRKITPEKIVLTVAKVYNIDPEDIYSKSRVGNIALARQVVMYYVRNKLKFSLEKTAELLKRKDHTTVLHACTKLERMRKNDQELINKMAACERELFN